MPDNKTMTLLMTYLTSLIQGVLNRKNLLNRKLLLKQILLMIPQLRKLSKFPTLFHQRSLFLTQKLRKNQVLRHRREMYVLRQPFLQKVKKEKERGKETDFRAYLFLQYLFSLYQYAYRL